MTRSRVEPLLLTLLLVLMTGVCLARGIGLVREPHRLAAHEERHWFEWAHPRSDTAARFAQAAASLAPGEVVCLVAPGRTKDWWQYMAKYYLPDQMIAAVRARGARRGLPPQATVLEIHWDGAMQVRRGDDGG
jgi:hypothetical protein